MQRRVFLARCGLAAAGALLLPLPLPTTPSLYAAGAVAFPAQATAGDRALLRLLSAYGSDAYFWGNTVLTRAAGVQTPGSVNLLVRVADWSRLVAFLRSDAVKPLGLIRVQDNTLSFTFQGTAYTVTNADPADFSRAAAGGGVTRGRAVELGLGTFTHQTLLYHPATDTLSDPHLVLTKRKVDLLTPPTGGIRARVQTLVDGLIESRRHGLKLGKKFAAFQDELLGSVPTKKAASKVLKTFLENLSELAGLFDVEDLRPLLTSPLISGTLQSELGLKAEEVLAGVEKLRGELAAGDYTDAALWLATLLGSHIHDGTVGEWLDLQTDDDATGAATRAALAGARRLVGTEAK